VSYALLRLYGGGKLGIDERLSRYGNAMVGGQGVRARI
jgi:hypothetical protein